MSYNKSARYTKVGATFASGAEAYADKNSLVTAEGTGLVEATYARMLAEGVLLEPVSYSWDQATYTLTVRKIVTSDQAYNDTLGFDSALMIQRGEEAGWTLVPGPVPQDDTPA
jgi:hypothetical protein